MWSLGNAALYCWRKRHLVEQLQQPQWCLVSEAGAYKALVSTVVLGQSLTSKVWVLFVVLFELETDSEKKLSFNVNFEIELLMNNNKKQSTGIINQQKGCFVHKYSKCQKTTGLAGVWSFFLPFLLLFFHSIRGEGKRLKNRLKRTRAKKR